MMKYIVLLVLSLSDVFLVNARTFKPLTKRELRLLCTIDLKWRYIREEDLESINRRAESYYIEEELENQHYSKGYYKIIEEQKKLRAEILELLKRRSVQLHNWNLEQAQESKALLNEREELESINKLAKSYDMEEILKKEREPASGVNCYKVLEEQEKLKLKILELNKTQLKILLNEIAQEPYERSYEGKKIVLRHEFYKLKAVELILKRSSSTMLRLMMSPPIDVKIKLSLEKNYV